MICHCILAGTPACKTCSNRSIDEWNDSTQPKIVQIIESVGNTLDCVEVVRCKDCKYLSTSHSIETMNGEKRYRCFYEVSRLYVNPDDFCSYGERE